MKLRKSDDELNIKMEKKRNSSFLHRHHKFDFFPPAPRKKKKSLLHNNRCPPPPFLKKKLLLINHYSTKSLRKIKLLPPWAASCINDTFYEPMNKFLMLVKFQQHHVVVAVLFNCHWIFN